ncbi:hypothetical protein BE21_28795 [Sorangium cellulosum]|uniref:HEPN domain-containing protein n=1 Tax=Sorangium cellulosum TaxID=56 RepID=A0A150TSK3_SORCE|nr:hypothetical protein BE21_28795 [Sorangium cellulosum]
MARSSALTLSTKAADLLSAALRHVRDAEHLLDPAAGYTSPDQAYHLAGYGPECGRKATVSLRWLDQAVGHGVETSAADVTAFMLDLDPLARRYDVPMDAARCPALSAWRVEARYQRTGARSRSEAQALCQEAREVVDSVVVALWADGRIAEGHTPW